MHIATCPSLLVLCTSGLHDVEDTKGSFPAGIIISRNASPRPHYAGGIWKRKFHSENASNVLEFRPHYAGEI